jgi:hypothetical protein
MWRLRRRTQNHYLKMIREMHIKRNTIRIEDERKNMNPARREETENECQYDLATRHGLNRNVDLKATPYIIFRFSEMYIPI